MAGGIVKLVFMCKFKDTVSKEQIEEFIKAYEKLVDAIAPMHKVEYGADLGSANYQQGFTHVFQSTFENKEGVAHFLGHPAHAQFLETHGGPKLDNFIVVDYYPTLYPPPSSS